MVWLTYAERNDQGTKQKRQQEQPFFAQDANQNQKKNVFIIVHIFELLKI